MFEINRIKVQIDNEEEKYYKDEYDLFFNLLLEKKIDFTKLSNVYVNYLNNEKEKISKQLSEIDMPLIETYKKSKHLTIKNTKDCIVRYLVKYKRFKGTPIFKELEQYIKDNDINLEGSYYMDLYNKKEDK